MFANGAVDIIRDENNELYINMWQLTTHILNSAEAMESVDGKLTEVSSTLRILASTLCDLAMFEIGKADLNGLESVSELLQIWSESE